MTTCDPKKLVEYLLGDLRTLSTEAKNKKFNHVKDAAESCIVKIRNINDKSGSHSLLQNIRSACTEILHPLILSCSTKNPRLVQIALQAIQHMLQFRVVSVDSAPLIVGELWNLTENECEELRVLQTLTPFVTAEVLVTDTALAKCIALAIHLNFSKDPSVINAASAAIRQLFSCVFERVIQEDGMKGNAEMVVLTQTVREANLTVPPTLRPCAADAWLLLKDLITLIRKENPTWLVGVKRISLTLALDLLESVLKNYPSIFFKHSEYSELLKNSICPQLVKLFAGEKDVKLWTNNQENNLANRRSMSNMSSASMQSTSLNIQKPFFSIMMRSIRITYVLISHYHEILALQSEILVTFLLELLSPDVQEWQSAVALEVLHKLTAQPSLIAWFCENYDMQSSSTKLIELITNKLKSFIVKMLEHAAIDDTLNERDVSSATRVSQSGFVFNGSFTPLAENISAKRWVVLEWLEKNEPAAIQQGYSLSVAYYSLIDITHSVYAVIEEQSSPTFRKNNIEADPQKHKEVSAKLFSSSYPQLLEGFSVLLASSIDDSISETVLNCMSTLVVLACRTENNVGRDLILKAICKSVLPQNYFVNYIEPNVPSTPNGSLKTDFTELKSVASDATVNGEQNQVIAMSSVCPTLLASQTVATVMLTSKNMQVARLLLTCIQSNGKMLNESWDVVLTTLQHLYWILGMKPTSTGGFKSDSSSTGSSDPNINLNSSSFNNSNITTIVTTALSSELPNINQMLNKVFEQTSEYTDVSLHHIIAALCKLSTEAMSIAQNHQSKEPSFFSVAKLLQIGLNNLQRFPVFWRPIVAHLLEICAHNNSSLRDWGSTALTTLVKSGLQALPTVPGDETDKIKYEQLILTPLASMNEIDYTDVRTKQLACIMNFLQSDKCQFHSQIWPIIVPIVTSVVESKNTANAELVDQAFTIVKLIIKEFLTNLPFDCVQMIVEMNSQYGHQQINMNISLASVGLLWDISDYLKDQRAKHEPAQVEQMWLVLYNCLSELCVDSRPPIRKSACDTFLQTIAAHGHALDSRTWSHMIWKILFPMLDKVRSETRSASTQKSGGAGLGAANIMVHHSRDTESKQWAETTVRTLSGVVKIFNAQRNILLTLENFGSCWKNLLAYIEYVAGTDNSEMSLAALKNFQELLFGRGQNVSDGKNKNSSQEEVALPLPEKLWIISWAAWIRIARAVVSPYVPEKSLFNSDETLETQIHHKHYIPGTFHFTTLLSAFQPLFYRVSKDLELSEVTSNGVLSIFKAILKVPVSPEQGPFMINAQNSDISPAQECILDCLYVLYQKQLELNSKLKPGIPDLLKTLLEFVSYSIRPPTSEFLPSPGKEITWAQQNLISFGELSMRTCVSYYTAVARQSEIIDELIFVEIVKCLAEPLALKYQCPSQSTWKVAASSLNAVCLIGLPIAREKCKHFETLWRELATCIDNFLFNTIKSPAPLNADERKRHEYIDCQIIDLIRSEILPFADQVSNEFMQHIIEILNKGSINTMDSNDILASDSFQQRADLSRVCFDALLSLSRADAPENLNATENNRRKNSTANSLGSTAIASLLNRCKQVLNNYARDEQGSGHFRLPQERIFEVISVLRAVSTLIDGLTKHPEAVHSSLYSHLVGLHPNLVELIPSCRTNREVELALMTALNAYQTLLLLNIHSKP